MNSFIFKGKYDLLQTIDEYRKMEGITHLEFNYPEHVVGYDLDEIKKTVLENHNATVKFVDIPDAVEYRETLKMEQSTQ